jgi:hypothetical protein
MIAAVENILMNLRTKVDSYSSAGTEAGAAVG